jgi:hypothetical protein
MTIIEPNGYFENGVWINGLNKSMIGKKIIRLEPCHCNPDSPTGGYYDFSMCLIGCFGDDRRDDEGRILKNITDDGKLVMDSLSRVFSEDHVLEAYWNDGNWIAHSDIEKFRDRWIGKVGKIHPANDQFHSRFDDECDDRYIEIECPYCKKISSHGV